VEVKDDYDRLKFKLNEKMKKCEALIEERNKYKDSTEGKKILARKKAEKKIEQSFEDINLDIKEMEKELKHQKKNPKKFPDIKTKEKIFDLLKKKLNILKAKYDDNDYDEDEYSQNENQIQTLENFLSSKQNFGGDNYERDIYEEEENKIGEWNKRVKQQDEQLDEIHKGVGKLKKEAGTAGIGINKIGTKVKKLNKHTDKTQKSVKSQNERLKELVFKMRSADKYCCDIILILILIGLVCTLYSIIKHKF
jgi:hypothetical protein